MKANMLAQDNCSLKKSLKLNIVVHTSACTLKNQELDFRKFDNNYLTKQKRRRLGKFFLLLEVKRALEYSDIGEFNVQFREYKN